VTVLKYIFVVLFSGIVSQLSAQNPNELAARLQQNYDSTKNVILNLELDKPYPLDDIFWLEQQLMRNMLSQESFEAADKFALSLAKKHKGTSKEASCYVNRGNLFYFTGQINEAIEAYNRAIEIAKKDKQTTDVARANNNKAGCHTQLGE
jgi:tetratricopeptide (TPR) repeat protein